MSGPKPTKKQFAEWINQTVGHNVVNERFMDQLLLDAKKSYAREGLDGFFEYIRQLTQAPVSNGELKQLMDTVLGAGDPAQALRQLSDGSDAPAGRSRLLQESTEVAGSGQRRKKRRGKGTRG